MCKKTTLMATKAKCDIRTIPSRREKDMNGGGIWCTSLIQAYGMVQDIVFMRHQQEANVKYD